MRLSVWPVYVLLAGAMIAYSVIVSSQAGRHGFGFELWGGAALEIAAAALCLARAYEVQARRPVAWMFGLALLSWALGDIATGWGVRAGWQFSPLIPEALHSAFYALAAAGLFLLAWETLGHAGVSGWLDGIIAGLGAAAGFAVIAFQALPQTIPPTPWGLIHLSNPIAIVLLAASLAIYFAVMSSKLDTISLILGCAFAMIIVQSTANIVQTASRTPAAFSALGFLVWSIAFLLISVALWLEPADEISSRGFHLSTLLLPLLAASCALGIQFANAAFLVHRVGLLLATLTLLVAGIRLFLLLRETEAISEYRQEQAATDELTGLWNRRHLFRQVDAYFAGRAAGTESSSLAFLFVDLNRFKEINDSFGHTAGDQLLKLVGDRLAGSVRDSDVLIRLGGDEFAVLLPKSDAESARTVALRLSGCLDRPFQLNRVAVSIGASIGIALAPADAQDTRTLVRCADCAMYRAKTENSRLAVYEPSLDIQHDGMRLMQAGYGHKGWPADSALPAAA